MTIDTRRRPSSSAGGSERSARHPPSGATSPSAPQSALGGRQRLRDGECHSGVLPVGYHTADRGCGAVIVRCGCVECREGRPRGRASYHCRRDGTGRHGGRGSAADRVTSSVTRTRRNGPVRRGAGGTAPVIVLVMTRWSTPVRRTETSGARLIPKRSQGSNPYPRYPRDQPKRSPAVIRGPFVSLGSKTGSSSSL
jgi:hypothetical protein